MASFGQKALSVYIVSSIVKMEVETKYMETEQGLYRTAQGCVCACIHVHTVSPVTFSVPF